MLRNHYWLLSKKRKQPSLLIAELTEDGILYIWPLVASVTNQYRPPEDDQDPEALLADGDFIQMSGYYTGIQDFMNHSKYGSSSYEVTLIGGFESIRACRAALSEIVR